MKYQSDTAALDSILGFLQDSEMLSNINFKKSFGSTFLEKPLKNISAALCAHSEESFSKDSFCSHRLYIKISVYSPVAAGGKACFEAGVKISDVFKTHPLFESTEELRIDETKYNRDANAFTVDLIFKLLLSDDSDKIDISTGNGAYPVYGMVITEENDIYNIKSYGECCTTAKINCGTVYKIIFSRADESGYEFPDQFSFTRGLLKTTFCGCSVKETSKSLKPGGREKLVIIAAGKYTEEVLE